MIPLVKLSSEAYRADGEVNHVGPQEAAFLSTAAHASPRHRCRILLHKSNDDALHSMLVAYCAGTYIRPNRHKGKDESVLVVRGSCVVCFFDGAGTMTRAVNLNERGSPLAYYCRIPQGVYHSVLVPRDCVLFESTPGPFDPADTEYAPWSPEEGDLPETQRWTDRAHLAAAVKTSNDVSPLATHGEAVLVASGDVAAFGDHEEHVVKKMVADGLTCSRICAHKDESDRLQEMLLCFASGSAPSRHKKDETLYALEGTANYVFFDGKGEATRIIPLAPGVCCRVPAGVYHSLVVDGPFLALEAAPGPFKKSDTEYADWGKK